ncbi:MAG: hypothetical protein WCC97_08400 [Candidatus Acidiferrales bacterium]
MEGRVQHIRFDLAALEHLEEIARNQGGRSLQSLIRQIVDEYLRAHPDRDDFREIFASVAPAPSKSEEGSQ